jgi:hypothetical protein
MPQPGVSFAPSRAAGSFVDQLKARVVLLAVFVGSIWATFFLSVSMPFLHLNRHGVVPRTLSGLQGILFAPWLHAGLWHITANTGGLLALRISGRRPPAPSSARDCVHGCWARPILCTSARAAWCSDTQGISSHAVFTRAASSRFSSPYSWPVATD